jgi:hypothetical protein
MNQEDFRRLFENKKQKSSGKTYGGKRQLSDNDLSEIKKLLSKKHKGKKSASYQKDKIINVNNNNNSSSNSTSIFKEKQEVNIFESKYRDRAAERRSKEINSGMIEVTHAADDDGKKALPSSLSVKGLDFKK